MSKLKPGTVEKNSSTIGPRQEIDALLLQLSYGGRPRANVIYVYSGWQCLVALHLMLHNHIYDFHLRLRPIYTYYLKLSNNK